MTEYGNVVEQDHGQALTSCVCVQTPGMLTHFGWCTWGKSADAQHATIKEREPASLCWSSPEAPLAVTCACLMDEGEAGSVHCPPPSPGGFRKERGDM